MGASCHRLTISLDFKSHPYIRCSAHIRSEALLDHFALHATEPTGTAQNYAMSDNANLAEAGFQTFRPDPFAVATNMNICVVSKPMSSAPKIAGENPFAYP